MAANPPRPDARAPGLGGPRSLSALLPALTRPAFRRRSPAAAGLMADWASIVGPSLAAETRPQRLSAGALTIACSGPMAMQLQHLAPQLIQRINGSLGRQEVQVLRFVQLALPRPAPLRAKPRDDAPLPSQVEDRLASLPEGELREALSKLARGVYRTSG